MFAASQRARCSPSTPPLAPLVLGCTRCEKRRRDDDTLMGFIRFGDTVQSANDLNSNLPVATVALTLTQAQERRQRVFQLGEDIAPSILTRWSDSDLPTALLNKNATTSSNSGVATVHQCRVDGQRSDQLFVHVLNDLDLSLHWRLVRVLGYCLALPAHVRSP